MLTCYRTWFTLTTPFIEPLVKLRPRLKRRIQTERKMYAIDNDVNARIKLKVGDKVRISKTRRTFDKGNLPNWTEEIFSESKTIATTPPTYKLVDYGEEVKGSFYDKELQRVNKKDEIYKVEKIL